MEEDAKILAPLGIEDSTKTNDETAIAIIPLKETSLKLWKIAGPFLISNAIKSFSGFWGMQLLANAGGAPYNAAETPITALKAIIFTSLIVPFTTANMEVASKYTNSNEQGDIINVVLASLLHATAAGAITIPIINFIPNVLHSMAIPAQSIEITSQFFDSLKYGIIPFCLSSSLTQTLFALNDGLPIFAISFITGAASVFLQTAWIEGKFFFPQEMAIGLGKANSLEFGISAFLLSLYTFQKIIRHRNLRENFSIKKTLSHLLNHSLKGVLFAVSVNIGMSAVFGMSMLVSSQLDKNKVGLFNIVLQCISLTQPIPFSLSTATTSLMGNLIGYRNAFFKDRIPEPSSQIILKKNANKIIFAAGLSNTIFCVAQLAVFISAAGWIYSRFTSENEEQNINLLRILFGIVCSAQILEGMKQIFAGAIFGKKNIIFPLIDAFIFVLVLGLAGTYLALKLELGLIGVAASSAIVSVISAISYFLYWNLYDIKKLATNNSSDLISCKKVIPLSKDENIATETTVLLKQQTPAKLMETFGIHSSTPQKITEQSTAINDDLSQEKETLQAFI